MAGDWIRLRADLQETPKFAQFVGEVPCSDEFGIFVLYRVTSWFASQSKYGKIAAEPQIIDTLVESRGVAAAMMNVGWLRFRNGQLMLHGFAQPTATRKSIGGALRAQVLSVGSCAAFGSSGPLVIDHIIPIVLGGSCDRDNLQALCEPCNRKKGRRTMDEFMAGGTEK